MKIADKPMQPLFLGWLQLLNRYRQCTCVVIRPYKTCIVAKQKLSLLLLTLAFAWSTDVTDKHFPLDQRYASENEQPDARCINGLAMMRIDLNIWSYYSNINHCVNGILTRLAICQINEHGLRFSTGYCQLQTFKKVCLLKPICLQKIGAVNWISAVFTNAPFCVVNMTMTERKLKMIQPSASCQISEYISNCQKVRFLDEQVHWKTFMDKGQIHR